MLNEFIPTSSRRMTRWSSVTAVPKLTVGAPGHLFILAGSRVADEIGS